MAIEQEEIITFLTPEQAALFILFQQHYDNISYLLSQKVFDVIPGNVILHIDDTGRVKSIKKETFEFRK